MFDSGNHRMDFFNYCMRIVARCSDCDTLFRLWHTVQIVACRSDCGTPFRLWNTVQVVARCSGCGTQFRLWHAVQIVARCSDCGTLFRLAFILWIALLCLYLYFVHFFSSFFRMVLGLKLHSGSISTELIHLRKRIATRSWCVMQMSFVTLSAGERKAYIFYIT